MDGSRERRDRFGDRARVDQRLVALHVDDDVAVERRGDLGQAIGAGRVIGARQPDVAAELGHAGGDAQIVGRDDDARHDGRRRGAPIHVLDHRTAVDVGERLAGESRRGESGGDDGDDVERKSGIDRRTSRCRVHDE